MTTDIKALNVLKRRKSGPETPKEGGKKKKAGAKSPVKQQKKRKKQGLCHAAEKGEECHYGKNCHFSHVCPKCNKDHKHVFNTGC